MSKLLEAIGLKEPKRQIYNRSDDETIFLIPFRASVDMKDEELFQVDRDLVEKIPARGSIEVNCSKYDLGKKNQHFQMCILFRAGKGISTILEKDKPNCVKLAEGEKAYIYSQLAVQHKWYFRHDKRQGIVVPTDASQTEFELRYLRDEVEELKKAVKALQKTIEDRLPQSTHS